MWKLKDDNHKPVSNKAWLWALIGIAGGLLMGALGYQFLSGKKLPAETAAAPTVLATPAPVTVYEPGKQHGLRLFEGKTTFAMHLLQTVDLRLPCSGLLTIDLKFAKGAGLCVFLLTEDERDKMKAGKTCTHVEGFDAKVSSGTYRQEAEVAPGRYTLVLLDENKSRGVVEINARLSNLK